MLFILSSKGLLGKNQFEDFTVSPVMVFTKCQPMLRQNSFININIREDRQETLEKDLIAQFNNELQHDSYFYIIDSKSKEEAVWEVILKVKLRQIFIINSMMIIVGCSSRSGAGARADRVKEENISNCSF